MRKVWLITFNDNQLIALSKPDDVLDNILAYCYTIIAGDEYGKPTSNEIAEIRNSINFFKKQNFSTMGIGQGMFAYPISVECVELR